MQQILRAFPVVQQEIGGAAMTEYTNAGDAEPCSNLTELEGLTP